MRWLHGQSGYESTGYTRSVVQRVGGFRAWPIDICSNKDAGRSQSETPTPCECEQARRQILIRQDFHCGSSRCWQRNIREGKWYQKSCNTPQNQTKIKMQHEPDTHCVFIYLFMNVGACVNHHGRSQTSHGPFYTYVLCDVRRVVCPCSLFTFLSDVRIPCQCFTCQWRCEQFSLVVRGSPELSTSLCPRDENGATGCSKDGGCGRKGQQAGAQLPSEKFPDSLLILV